MKTMTIFAVYIPVGPSRLDLFRLEDLLESLFCYEPNVSAIVIADHGPEERDFSTIEMKYSDTKVNILRPRRQEHNGSWLGSACVANLMMMDYASRIANIDLVLKMDTDALIIAPFSETLGRLCEDNPRIGIAGTLGNTCNKSARTQSADATVMNILLQMHSTCQSIEKSEELDNATIVKWNLFTVKQREVLGSLCGELEPLLRNGFKGQHCQGGAYAVTGALIVELRDRGLLSQPERWRWLPIGEDRMMGMYCALAGFEVADLSDVGQPFGVQAYGLAFDPEVLIERGYGVIHSVRSHPGTSEENVRRFFRARRKG
jgi:hypothetical protein